MVMIRTVRGDIAPTDLGVCYPHEHLLTRPPTSVTDADLTMRSEEAAVRELGYFRLSASPTGRAMVAGAVLG